MNFKELREQAIKNFFEAWNKIQLFGLDVYEAETYRRISCGDIIIDEKGSV